MCGICGFTGAVEADLPILKAMCDVMAHRLAAEAAQA